MKSRAFTGHGLWAELEAVNEVTFAIEAQTLSDMSPQFDEVRELAAVVGSFRKSEDYALFSMGMLESMLSAWKSIRHLLESTREPAGSKRQLQGVLEQLDSAREVLALWPRPIGSVESQAAFNRARELYLVELERGRALLESELRRSAEHNEGFRAQTAELLGALKRAQAEVSKLERRVADGEERLANALTHNNETFIAAQTAREAGFNDWLRERETEFGAIAEPYLEAIQSAAAEAEDNLQVVTGLRTSTVEMAGMAAGDFMAGAYEKHANAERIASYIAYGVGVTASLGSLAIVLFAFGALSETTDWRQVVLKITLTAGVGAVATVAFRFAGQAVRRATSFKRQELELRALHPLLKDVGGADGAKTAFLERAFGHSWVENGSGKSEPELNDALLKLLTTSVQQATKTPASSS